MEQFSWESLSKLIEIVVIPFLIYVAKSLSEMKEKLRTLETVLIGADGKNGIRSRVRRNEVAIQNLSVKFAAKYGDDNTSRIIHYDDGED